MVKRHQMMTALPSSSPVLDLHHRPFQAPCTWHGELTPQQSSTHRVCFVVLCKYRHPSALRDTQQTTSAVYACPLEWLRALKEGISGTGTAWFGLKHSPAPPVDSTIPTQCSHSAAITRVHSRASVLDLLSHHRELGFLAVIQKVGEYWLDLVTAFESLKHFVIWS